MRGAGSPARSILLGLGLGAVAAALVWQFYPGFWSVPPDAEVAAAVQRSEALARQAPVQVAPAPPAPTTTAASTPCAFEPLIPPQGAGDGQLRMEHPFPASARAKAKVFLRKAHRAAASGRLRDAETALIASCRYDVEASARPNVPIARVLGLLGDRYTAAAAAATSSGLREQLVARAREVLALSAATYAKALGPNAPRSRQARQRLAALDAELIAATDAPPPQEQPAVTASVAPQARKEPSSPPPKGAAAPGHGPRIAKASAPAAPEARQDAREPAAPPEPPQPSDPELRQLASDLARLQAQAEAVSDDPAALQRRARAAASRRAQCGDAACLRDWYAQRRRELLAEF